jgi:O-antigen/teichoic acid export membrane protein
VIPQSNFSLRAIEETPAEPAERSESTRLTTAQIQQEATKKHIRGSSLLLVGRVLSLLTHLCTQVLLVRALSKSDFGAFAYALSVISVGKSIAVFGLDKSLTRFVPIHQEKRDYDKMFGTIMLMFGTVLSLGIVIILTVYGLREWFSPALVADEDAVSLLLVLIILSPVEALESLLTGMFAIFSSPRAIFFRKNLLGPQLQLVVVVLVLIIGQANVYFVAGGYVGAGLLGIVIYTSMLIRLLREQGLLKHFNRATLKLPSREILYFTLPLLISDVVFVLRNSLIVVLLEFFKGNTDVAHFRAVLPVARINSIVYQNFMVLFMPLASRMFARNERQGINNLYWQTAIWIAVISFPIFAVSFGFAQPLTVLLFGERYTESAVVLMILSVGYYFNCVLGFNGLSLRVFGKVRYMFVVDLVLAMVTLSACALVIPRYGAVGAAVVAAGTLIGQNILYQIGLISGTDIKALSLGHLKVYVIIVIASVSLLLLPPVYASFAVVLLLSALVFLLSHKSLKIGQTFPELLRLPLVRRVLVDNDSSASDADETERTINEGETIKSFLSRNAERYFPELNNAPIDIRLIDELNRSQSRIYRFQLASDGQVRYVRVKVPTYQNGQQSQGKLKLDRRPRRFSVADLEKKFQFEYLALSHIRKHFENLHDARFGTVNVLDSLPVLRGSVMEEIKAPTLTSLFVRENRLRLVSSSKTSEAFAHAGAWLRAYHSLPIEASVRHQTREEFIEVNRKLSDYLSSKSGDHAYFQKLIEQITDSASRVLPESLPVGLSHGDYAMRNVLVGAGSRVTVLDTLACWRTAIYEDIGYFLTNLKLSWPQVMSQGIVFRQSLIKKFEETFLSGYFRNEPVPIQAVRLFEIQALLDRWSGRVARFEQLVADGSVPTAKRLKLTLESRYYRRSLDRLIQSVS